VRSEPETCSGDNCGIVQDVREIGQVSKLFAFAAAGRRGTRPFARAWAINMR
jgi:hypothetical protein